MTRKRRLWLPLSVCLAVACQPSPTGSRAGGPAVLPPRATVTLTFDDGVASTYELAAGILAARDFPATVYVTTDFIGRTSYMTWPQVRELEKTHGWEIGSHAVTHRELPTLTDGDIAYEVGESKTILEAKGFKIESFASPFGAYDQRVLSEVARQYASHRGFWERDELNVWPYEDLRLRVRRVERETTFEEARGWIDVAISDGSWLILVFHEVVEAPIAYRFSASVGLLESLVEYLDERGVNVVTVREAITQSTGTPVIVENAWSDDNPTWSTDKPSLVHRDDRGYGSIPDPRYSIVMRAAGGENSHLFTSSYQVGGSSQYLVKAFVNASMLQSGELGFYMDEFGSGGEWISGQWLGMVGPGDVTRFARLYLPTSGQVVSSQLQVYLTAEATGEAFVDNVMIQELAR